MSTNQYLSGINATMSVDCVQYMKKIDFVDELDFIYIGEANPGASVNAPQWRISRTNTNDSAANGIAVEWAEGSANFSHEWVNHLTLNYS